MDSQKHFCEIHQSKFFRNEKIDAQTGESKVWYSHKLKDGSGFCTEKAVEKYEQPTLLPLEQKTNTPSRAMFVCNAMNNAVALASNGKIQVSEIGREFRKLLLDLQTI